MPRPMSFDDDTAVRPAGDGAFEGEIVDGWATPRGPLGGYVMAIVVRAMELAVDDPERTARSATMHFLRVPELGPVTVRTTVERAGRSLTSMSARLEQDGKLLGIAVGAWSKPWQGPTLGEPAMPEAEPASERGPLRPTFPATSRRRSSRSSRCSTASGIRRSRDRAAARSGGWLGLLERRPIDAPAIAVLADAWFPAPWPRLAELAPAPTIDLTVHFRVPLPIADRLLLGRFRNRLVRDGFFDEDGELWAADGTLVAQSRQLGLLIGLPADRIGPTLPLESRPDSWGPVQTTPSSRSASTERDLPALHSLWDEVIDVRALDRGADDHPVRGGVGAPGTGSARSPSAAGRAARWRRSTSAASRARRCCAPRTRSWPPRSRSGPPAGGSCSSTATARTSACSSTTSWRKAEAHSPKAAILVHIGGHIAFDSARIAAYCREHQIFLIEDCAHAHGASWDGTRPGEYGDAGVYSFYATKTVSTGEGGMLVSRHPELLEHARAFRNYGKPDYTVAGLNFRISEFAAAIGIVQTERMREIVA